MSQRNVQNCVNAVEGVRCVMWRCSIKGTRRPTATVTNANHSLIILKTLANGACVA